MTSLNVSQSIFASLLESTFMDPSFNVAKSTICLLNSLRKHGYHIFIEQCSRINDSDLAIHHNHYHGDWRLDDARNQGINSQAINLCVPEYSGSSTSRVGEVMKGNTPQHIWMMPIKLRHHADIKCTKAAHIYWFNGSKWTCHCARIYGWFSIRVS